MTSSSDQTLTIIIMFFFQACGDAKSKPSFLSDKSLESCIKQIIRKFPNIDSKSVCWISFSKLSHFLDNMKIRLAY